MTQVFINPGSGPVDGATLDHAYANMTQLLKDAGLKTAAFARNPDPDSEEDDGRFAFLVTIPGAERFGPLTVDMPGIPLDEVRYTQAPGQNIWHFPRLYVDGSSWVWMFAVSRLRDWISDHEEGEEERRKDLLAARREREGSPSEGDPDV